MAEILQDEADKMLESLFRSEPVRDDDFSVNVVKRVRRKMWIQRLSMPVAMAIGTAIAAKPLVQLATVIPNLMTAVPTSVGSVANIEEISVGSLSQTSTIILGLVLLGAIMMVSQLLEE